MTLRATTWQTVGPYFRIGFEPRYMSNIAVPDTDGEVAEIEGRVLDGLGKPVCDAVLETWQADADGIYGDERRPGAFFGFGRTPTDLTGTFRLTTIKPGRVMGPDGSMQSPHLAVRIMMRGLLKSLVTRMYFPCSDLEGDPVLRLVPIDRRCTLVAQPSEGRSSTYIWDVVLQGEKETVFFDL